MVRTLALAAAAALAVMALAATPASAGPFGPDAKYSGGSKSDPDIGGGGSKRGTSKVPWTRNLDFGLVHRPPPPQPPKKPTQK